MTVEICQFIPHALADAYRRAGWAVSPLLGHHGRWSMLAVRPEYSEPDKGSVAFRTKPRLRRWPSNKQP